MLICDRCGSKEVGTKKAILYIMHQSGATAEKIHADLCENCTEQVKTMLVSKKDTLLKKIARGILR